MNTVADRNPARSVAPVLNQGMNHGPVERGPWKCKPPCALSRMNNALFRHNNADVLLFLCMMSWIASSEMAQMPCKIQKTSGPVKLLTPSSSNAVPISQIPIAKAKTCIDAFSATISPLLFKSNQRQDAMSCSLFLECSDVLNDISECCSR